MRSTGRPHGSAIRGHHPPRSFFGVRPYSLNPPREERLRPCRHPPYDGGYLRGQLVTFRNHQKASRDAAPQCKRWTGTALLVSYIITATNSGISKESVHSELNTSSSSGSSQFGIKSNNNMVDICKSCANGAKPRWRRWRPCVVFISQDNVPYRRRLPYPTAQSRWQRSC